MGRFTAEVIYEPDQDRKLPYTAWTFNVAFNCVEERGPGIDGQPHVTEMEVESFVGAVAYCEKVGTRIQWCDSYAERILRWIKDEMKSQYVEAAIRKKCAEAYQDMCCV